MEGVNPKLVEEIKRLKAIASKPENIEAGVLNYLDNEKTAHIIDNILHSSAIIDPNIRYIFEEIGTLYSVPIEYVHGMLLSNKQVVYLPTSISHGTLIQIINIIEEGITRDKERTEREKEDKERMEREKEIDEQIEELTKIILQTQNNDPDIIEIAQNMNIYRYIGNYLSGRTNLSCPNRIVHFILSQYKILYTKIPHITIPFNGGNYFGLPAGFPEEIVPELTEMLNRIIEYHVNLEKRDVKKKINELKDHTHMYDTSRCNKIFNCLERYWRISSADGEHFFNDPDVKYIAKNYDVLYHCPDELVPIKITLSNGQLFYLPREIPDDIIENLKIGLEKLITYCREFLSIRIGGSYYHKYLKYKNKYLNLKNKI